MKKNTLKLLVLSCTVLTTTIGFSSFIINDIINNRYTVKNEIGEEPVAYIIGHNEVYTTIEKALDMAQDGDIVCLIPPNLDNYNDENNKVIPDKVTYKITRNCEIKSGVSLVIPTDRKTLDTISDQNTLNNYLKSMSEDTRNETESRGSLATYAREANTNKNAYLRVTLEIADNVILRNNGNLIVSGYLSGGSNNAGMIGQTSHSYSQITLGKNSKIIQENENANLYCYGYITEKDLNNNSRVTLSNGNLFIPFIVNDYRGFAFSWSMTEGAISDERCSAFNQFELKNIENIVEINYTANVYGQVNVYVQYSAAGTDIKHGFSKLMSLVGNDNDSMIQFNDQSFSSLTYKYSKSESVGRLNLIGGAVLNPLNLNLSYSIVNVDLSTSEAYLPLSYRFFVELNAAPGQELANFDFTKQRLKVLPGGTLKVNDKCRLNGNEIIVYSAFYDGQLGNGSSSFNAYNTVKYPLKEGGKLIVDRGGTLNATSLAGAVYGDEQNFSYDLSEILSKEPWSYKSSGNLMPAWVIGEYLEINEKLQIFPLSYLTDKKKIYVGVNTFQNYSSFKPAFDILINNESIIETVMGFQKVIHVDNLINYSIKLKNNISKIYNFEKYYSKNSLVDANNANIILGAINSSVSISSDLNDINEFDVQSIKVSCSTPTINGKIPLYVDKSIQLEAEIDNIEKIYDKNVEWYSLDNNIAIVDNDGTVTGVAIGKTTIQCKCDGVIGSFDVEVLESEILKEIKEIYITDNSKDPYNSKDLAGEDEDENGNKHPYNGTYGNNKTIVYSLNVDPLDAPYATIEWKFKPSAVGRQRINDKTLNEETVYNEKAITLHTGSGTGASHDYATLTCKVTDLNGKVFNATFRIRHESDFCFASGTEILLSDGTYKVIEKIKPGDKVLTWNFFNHTYDEQIILFAIDHGEKEYELIRIEFSNGKFIEIIEEHGVFDITLNRFVYINALNYEKYLKHDFALYSKDGFVACKISNVKIYTKLTHAYSTTSSYNYNVITNDLLTSPPPENLYNWIPMSDIMKYDVKKFEQDVKKYGLYDYSVFKPYGVREETFKYFNGAYLKIPVEKGIFTFDYIIEQFNLYKEWINY